MFKHILFSQKAEKWLPLGSVLLCIVFLFFHSLATLFPVWVFWLVAMIVIPIAFLFPASAVPVLVGVLPLELPEFSTGIWGLELRLYQILVMGVSCGYMWGYFKGKTKIKLLWPDKVVFMMVVASFLTSVMNEDMVGSLKLSFVFFFCALLYGVMRYTLGKLSDVARIIPSIIGSMFVVGVYSLIQNVLFDHGILNNAVMSGRPYGSFPEPDWLGAYLAFGIAVLLGIVLFLRRRSVWEKKNMLLWFIVIDALFFSFLALILTVSRSAWVASMAAATVFLCAIFFGSESKKISVRTESVLNYAGIIAGVAFFAASMITLFGLSRFDLNNRLESTVSGMQEITVACQNQQNIPKTVESIDDLAQYGCRHINLEDRELMRQQGLAVGTVLRPDPNIGVRMRVWTASARSIVANPFFGIGWANIGPLLGMDGRGTPLNSSNIFLEYAMGLGIVGFFGILFLFGYVFILSIKVLARQNDSPIVWTILMTGASIVVANIFNSGSFLGYLWAWFGICVSILARSSRDWRHGVSKQ